LHKLILRFKTQFWGHTFLSLSYLFAGAVVCSLCSDGKYSRSGSTACEAEVPAFQVTVTLPLLYSAFTLELQHAFIAGISQVSNLPMSNVNITGYYQLSDSVPARRLLGSVLQVNTEIKTIESLLQGAISSLANKTALDTVFQSKGLPAPMALDMQLYCAAGQYAPKSSSACFQCSAGTYSTIVGLVTACQSCASGQYTTGLGATSCSDGAVQTKSIVDLPGA
jgi:hypothetical protein